MNKSGMGYVYLPIDRDPKAYYKYCQATSTICLMLQNGGVIENVVCSTIIFNELEFPEQSDRLGSQVFWVRNSDSGLPVVVAILNKVNQSSVFSVKKKGIDNRDSGGVANLTLDKGDYSTLLSAMSLKKGGGNVTLISRNQSNTSKFHILSSGEIKLTTKKTEIINKDKLTLIVKDALKQDSKTTIIIERGKGISIEDEFGNKVVFSKDGIVINDGKNNGLMNVDVFKRAFNQQETNTDIFKQAAIVAISTLSGILDGGATGTVFLNTLNTIQSPSIDGIEDEKVTH